MQDGLYLAQFGVGSARGHGIALITGNQVQGGDSAYWWTGNISADNDDTLSGTLIVKKHSSGVPSVFGFFDTFDLKISGRLVGKVGQFKGTTSAAPGRTMELNLRLLQPDP